MLILLWTVILMSPWLVMAGVPYWLIAGRKGAPLRRLRMDGNILGIAGLHFTLFGVLLMAMGLPYLHFINGATYFLFGVLELPYPWRPA